MMKIIIYILVMIVYYFALEILLFLLSKYVFKVKKLKDVTLKNYLLKRKTKNEGE